MVVVWTCMLPSLWAGQAQCLGMKPGRRRSGSASTRWGVRGESLSVVIFFKIVIAWSGERQWGGIQDNMANERVIRSYHSVGYTRRVFLSSFLLRWWSDASGQDVGEAPEKEEISTCKDHSRTGKISGAGLKDFPFETLKLTMPFHSMRLQLVTRLMASRVRVWSNSEVHANLSTSTFLLQYPN